VRGEQMRASVVTNRVNLPNVQSAHFKVVDAQCAHTPAFHGERANGEPSDGNRTDRSGPEGERAECHRTKTESARGACRLSLVCPGLASRRLNLSISSLPNLRIGVCSQNRVRRKNERALVFAPEPEGLTKRETLR
jgi:hypothetical protein